MCAQQDVAIVRAPKACPGAPRGAIVEAIGRPYRAANAQTSIATKVQAGAGKLNTPSVAYKF
jgi:hypothetical protein